MVFSAGPPLIALSRLLPGIAAATGKSVDAVRRVMWLGELTRGGCSMFGAWGDATKSRDGKLLQVPPLTPGLSGLSARLYNSTSLTCSPSAISSLHGSASCPRLGHGRSFPELPPPRCIPSHTRPDREDESRPSMGQPRLCRLHSQRYGNVGSSSRYVGNRGLDARLELRERV